MAKNGGTNGNWTPVAREVKDKPWARNPHRFALWIHLLLRAAWKRHPTKYRGHDYDLHPGEFPTTIRELAKQTGLSRGTVERDILWYKAESMIETKTTGGSTLIKILNSPNYPFDETKFETNLGQSLGQGFGTLQKKGPKTEQGDTEEKEKKMLLTQQVNEIISYLNEKGKRDYRMNIEHPEIRARLNEGFTVEDCKSVIDNKVKSWRFEAEMRKYLRPETLFSKTKFEGYLNEAPRRKPENQGGQDD